MEQGQRRVLADLVELLKRKGFDSFNGFDLAAPVISTEGFRYAEDVRAMWESVPVSKDLYYEFNRGSKR